MTTPNDPNQQGLTPEALANQLFDAAITQGLTQNRTDPREAGRRVVGFLADAIFYALKATKEDSVVFLTETLIYAAASSCSGDEAARKELLKHIGDTITNAPPLPVNKPAVGKP